MVQRPVRRRPARRLKPRHRCGDAELTHSPKLKSPAGDEPARACAMGPNSFK